MDKQFWIQKWRDGDLGFHNAFVHPDLVEFFPKLGVPAGNQVFVPLCGKSRDLAWFARAGYQVLGVELSAIAAEDFFDENEIPYEIVAVKDFKIFRGGGVEIWNGDFFALEKEQLKNVRCVYDRASLVALPPELRKLYAERMQDLLPNQTLYLLMSFSYPENEMSGPPFSVDEFEIKRLFSPRFAVQTLDRKDFLNSDDPLRSRGLTQMVRSVSLLKE